MLLQGSHRFLGLTLPPLKHLGPLLVVWGGAMVMLVFIRDLGSSLMFFGGFLAILYVATNRISFVAMGLGLFAIGAWFFANTVGHVQNRIDTWRDPFDRALYEKPGGSYQIAQSLFAQADGGLFGTGFGQALITQPGGGAILPAPQTDLIYAVITNELGLAGACGLLLVYLMVVERGFKIAMLAQRLVLQAAGGRPDLRLRAAGVRDRRRRDEGHPAHRRDAAVRLLRRLLDRGQLRPARAAAADLRPGPPPAGEPVNAPVVRLFVLVVILFGLLVAFTSRWTVFDAEALRDNALNRRSLLEEQRIKRGLILARDGTVLARSVRRPGDTYTRRYPDGELFAHAVGYSYTSIGRAGTERSHNDQLIGRRSELVTAFESIFGRLERGRRRAHDARRERAAGGGAGAAGVRPQRRARRRRRQDRRRARDGLEPELRPEHARRPRRVRRAQPATRRARRSSTARRRTAIRPARR